MGKDITQDTVNKIDDVITDKGNITMSTKSVKIISGILIAGIMFILGITWGFKLGIDTKIDTIIDQMKIDKVELYEKIDELKNEEVYPNTIKNLTQDGDIKVLLDRTNSRQDINIHYDRGEIETTPPPDTINF